MEISVACRCGKRLRAAAHLAGKRATCPGCGKPVTIPEMPVSGAAIPASPPGVCPHCRGEMAAEDALCVQCGYHRELGKRLETVVGEPLMHACPRNYREEEAGGRLVFTRGPALKGGLPSALGVPAAGLVAIWGAWLMWPLAAGALLIVAVPLYLLAIHRETIVVDGKRLTVRHGPFPWPQRTVSIDDIEQLYCRKRSRWSQPHNRLLYRHEVCVLTRDGRRLRLIANLPLESHAFFFEERIEHFLGIRDREVEESLWQRSGLLVRFAVALILAIAAMSAAILF